VTRLRCLTLIVTSPLMMACHQQGELTFFEKSAWLAPLPCTARVVGSGAAVSDLTPVSDSSFAALFSDDRELVTFGRDFRPLHVLRYDNHGPRGVRHGISAAADDTMLFIADEAGALIKRFDYTGRERGSIQLHFIPRRVRLSGGTLIATPLVAGLTPVHLLFRVEGNEVKSLGAPIARYEDVGINTMANMASLAPFPNRAVLMHELAVPFGYVFRTGQRPELQNRFAVPLAAEVRPRVRRLPQPPITEQNVNEFTIVAFTAASSATTGRTYYVTRVGDGRRTRYQKLLVELDSTLHLHAVYPINANPHHMVYVDGPPAIIAVDGESNWFECRLR
jgi:hypothetical protein